MESSSFSGSSKRAKALANIAQVAHCLVDGCTADLSLCRDYHRRHKVCEAHSKTPKVTIGGREQRFCQQCSRFHSLVEFDEGKRSCRKRLDGHNRRRRKPQPESLIPQCSSSSSASGTRLVSFNSPQVVGGSGMVGYPWSGVVKTENGLRGVMHQQHQHQQLNYMETCSSPHFSYVDPNAAAAAAAAGSHKMMFSDMVDSGGALSLLSSATLNPVPPSMDYTHFHQTKLDVPSSASTLHFPHHTSEGSSHQTLSFTWE